MSRAHAIFLLTDAIAAAWLIFLTPPLTARVLHRAPPNMRVIVERTLIVLFALIAIIVALEIIGVIALPALAVTLYSLALPLAAAALFQSLWSSMSLLISQPFRIGEHVTIRISSVQEISGTVTDIDMHYTHVMESPEAMHMIPNATVLNSVVTRLPHGSGGNER